MLYLQSKYGHYNEEWQSRTVIGRATSYCLLLCCMTEAHYLTSKEICFENPSGVGVNKCCKMVQHIVEELVKG